ncbi:MAG: CHAT domain-containing protein [Coleofasciculus sp. B1-GNL1-01]|uniref:CHAT domain-containing protein n=1 Tax=Coleofasciculus sp. B1-GNL1-01 TaxID=3068484 RepID=UPI0032F8A4A2
MKPHLLPPTILLALLTLNPSPPTLAQPIIPANDNTGTVVNTTGDRVDITGGTLSPDNTNLFHSFQQFGLESEQIANFLSSPNIQNILSRVTGNNPSIINGLIQVTGSNANLFLINPSGIIFGANAQLNVPGNFTATTATGIGFNQNHWFNAFGDNNYSNLIGTPNQFAFDHSNSGSIINAGNLAVSAPHNLTLLAGQVVNTGELSAPGGTITVVAVPGSNLVQIAQSGNLLSLELEPPRDTQGNILPVTPLDLAELLTGTPPELDTQLTVSADNTVQLANSGITLPNQPGTSIISGSLNVANFSAIPANQSITIIGENVGLVDADINASGNHNGGIVRIGGDYQGQGSIPNAENTFISSDSIIQADSFLNGDGGRVIAWADNNTTFNGTILARGGNNSGNGGFVEVSGKNNLVFRGTVDVMAANGQAGNVLLDPVNITIVDQESPAANDNELNDNTILFSDETTDNFTLSKGKLESLSGNLTLEATNNITIEDIASNSLNLQTLDGQTITFKADADGNGVGDFLMNSGDEITTKGGAITIAGVNVDVGNINTSGVIASLFSHGGDITIVTDGGNINTGILRSWGSGTVGDSGTITLTANRGNIYTGAIAAQSLATFGDAGDINVTANNGNIEVLGEVNSSIDRGVGNAGTINLTANGGNIKITGTEQNSSISSLSLVGNGGEITVQATGNIEILGTIASLSGLSDTGNVTLTSEQGNISSGSLGSAVFSGTSGKVTINAPNGSINTGNIASLSFNGTGNDIRLTARNNLITGDLMSSGKIGSGTISLTVTNGSINALNSDLSELFNLVDLVPIEDYPELADLLKPITQLPTHVLDSSSSSGSGGAILLNAPNGDIITGGKTINSHGFMNAGDITLTSGGIIDTTGGIISAPGGIKGGDITLLAPGNIDTGTITVFLSGFSGDSGDISITSTEANINTSTGALITASGEGLGGNITLDAADNITMGQVNALSFMDRGGKIDLSAETDITIGGDIQTNQNNITLNAPVTLADNVALTTSESGGIIFNDNVNGGYNLTLTSEQGVVQFNDRVGHLTPLNNLQVQGEITTTNSSGIDITTLNRILTEDITSPGGISLTSHQRSITTQRLNTSALNNGGNITLKAPGNISVSQIDSQSLGNGNGGAVEISTGQFFQATDTFLDQNGNQTSISTAGVADGGSIFIRHGGEGITPFIVGNADINGTEGAITRGNDNPESQILPTQSYLHTHKQDRDRIQIISVSPASPPPPDPNPLPAEPNPSPQLTSGSPSPSSSNSESTPETPSNPNPLESLAFLVGDTLDVNPQINQDAETGNYTFTWKIPNQQILSLNVPYVQDSPQQLPINPGEDIVTVIDQLLEAQFETYLGEDLTQKKVTTASLQNRLQTMETQTGKRAVVIYALSHPDGLQLVLVPPEGSPISKQVPQANYQTLRREVKKFYHTLNDYTSNRYLSSSQQLYQWLIEPLATELDALNIDTLIFSMDAGLRTIPLAALHDGQQFLIETYSVGLIPSVSLTDTRYQRLDNATILAMGAAEFPDSTLSPLPAVPIELSTILAEVGQGKLLLNDQFTLENFKTQRRDTPFDIVHLSTHASFPRDRNYNPYIQLWQQRVGLNELRQVKWYAPPTVELLTLSACETAVGNEQAEMGFAGLAVQAGVKSALASLWKVDDLGTLAVMTEFYQQLNNENVLIKAEALRQAQLALLRSQVRIESSQLVGTSRNISVAKSLVNSPESDLSHPYYWAGFTLIGSPW